MLWIFFQGTRDSLMEFFIVHYAHYVHSTILMEFLYTFIFLQRDFFFVPVK